MILTLQRGYMSCLRSQREWSAESANGLNLNLELESQGVLSIQHIAFLQLRRGLSFPEPYICVIWNPTDSLPPFSKTGYRHDKTKSRQLYPKIDTAEVA